MRKIRMNRTPLCLVLLLALLLCSCGGNQKPEGTSAESDKNSTAEEVEYIQDEPHTDAAGMVIAPNAKSVRANKVLSVYQKAADFVKTNAVGFTKTQWQDFNDISTADRSGIADMVLTIVSKNVIVNNSPEAAAANPEKISSGNTAAVREKFPLFNMDTAYVESDNSDFISGAEYQKTDAYREYYLFFHDSFNPVIGDTGFGGIMTPFNRKEVIDGIKNYGWNVQQDTMKFDCTYTGCYMMFRVDNDGRLIHLEQHLFANIDAKAEVDLFVASTDFFNGTCRYEEHYTYTDFQY